MYEISERFHFLSAGYESASFTILFMVGYFQNPFLIWWSGLPALNNLGIAYVQQ
jgi:hypothetical protein